MGRQLAFRCGIGATGLLYICPQQIACRVFETDKPQEEWPPLVAKYIGDARVVADQLADRCDAEGRHFVYLDIDTTDFAAARKPRDKAGLIYMFRNEAPIPGSRIAVGMPTGPRSATAPTADVRLMPGLALARACRHGGRCSGAQTANRVSFGSRR